MQFTTDGIGTLLGNLADLLVAQVLIRDQEQQAPILLRQTVQGSLNSLPEFLGLKRPQRIPSHGRLRLQERGIVGDVDISCGPSLPQVGAMVEGDSVEPGPDLGVAPEGSQILESLHEHVMGGVLRLRRIPQKPQRQIIHRLRMGGINRLEIGRYPSLSTHAAPIFRSIPLLLAGDLLGFGRDHHLLWTRPPRPCHAGKTPIAGTKPSAESGCMGEHVDDGMDFIH